ncbi:MAG: nucleotidyltransferase family protein [Myxococcales bacterium]|nr:nucleotidyltransferase family protein [Myxococcales bacterium]
MAFTDNDRGARANEPHGAHGAYRDLAGRPIDPHAIVAIHSQARFALRVLLEALRARRVLAAPVKGIVTAGWLYPSVSERPISDVDVRVAPSALDLVLAIAKQNRWTIAKNDDVYRSLEIVIEGVTFDIETHFGALGMSSLDTTAALARGTRTTETFGVEHCRLTVHDHALLLALNVLKDRVGESAPWAVEDLVRVAREPTFDPDKLAAIAWSAANASALWAIATWLSETRASAPWGDVARAIGSVPREAYATRVREKLAKASSRTALDRAERRVLGRSASDRIEQRAKALATMGRWGARRLLAW